MLWPFDARQFASVLERAEQRALRFVEYHVRSAFDSTAQQAQLSNAEMGVTWMSVLGATAKDVARSRSVSVRTVESQRYTVLRKLGLTSTEQLRWKLLRSVLPGWRSGS